MEKAIELLTKQIKEAEEFRAREGFMPCTVETAIARAQNDTKYEICTKLLEELKPKAKDKYKATIDGLIECLTDIKKVCGGNLPLQVNVIGNECVTGLVSVCLDNDLGNEEALVYLETDTSGNICPSKFEFYTQGEEI